MKVRVDFITNSSSSSYLIVGVTSEDIIDKLRIAENINEFEFSYGIYGGEYISFIGYWNEASYAGIFIEDLMEVMTLPQLKEYFVQLVKDKFNIDIPLYLVNLHYGKQGDG